MASTLQELLSIECDCGQVHTHPPTYDELWIHCAWSDGRITDLDHELEEERAA
jgi:hypothetical protein